MSLMRDLMADDGGATSIEYAAIAGLMAIALVAGAALFTSKFSRVVDIIGAALG